MLDEKSFGEFLYLISEKGGDLPTGSVIEEYISNVSKSKNIGKENILADVIKDTIGYSIKSGKIIKLCKRKPRGDNYKLFDNEMNEMDDFIKDKTKFKVDKKFFLIETRPRENEEDGLQGYIKNLTDNYQDACSKKNLSEIRSLTYLYSPIFEMNNYKYTAIMLLDSEYKIYTTIDNYRLSTFNKSSKTLNKAYYLDGIIGTGIVKLKDISIPDNVIEIIEQNGGTINWKIIP